MSGLFDGIASMLSDVFGTEVTYAPTGGAPRAVQSVLRRSPVVATGPDGVDVLVTSPSWRVRRDLVPELRRGDLVEDAQGTLRVLNVWPQGSPAADAHLICELEDTTE
ncbi:head-tail joining protein [Pararhodobacter marinus]|uniref:head-tail joining protein n=1 Tax=Pararhodobacter marinus TaxID=2184063 RepID=UPI0035176D64